MLNLADEAGIPPCGYQLQNALKCLPIHSKKKGANRNNKWDRYFYFQNKTPSIDTLKEIHKKFPKSSYILTLPLWDIFKNHKEPEYFYYDFLLKMPSKIKRNIFKGNSPYTLKSKLPYQSIQAIRRMGNTHALGCLLVLGRMHKMKMIEFSDEIDIIESIRLLMYACSLRSPLNKAKAELYDTIVYFMNEQIDAPSDYVIIENKERFLYNTNRLKIVSEILYRWGIVEYEHNQVELIYWLIESDLTEVLTDLISGEKGIPLTDEKNGLLKVLRCMSYQTRSIIKERIRNIIKNLKSP